MALSLFFDTGPLISLTMSRLIWVLPLLKKKFGGSFYITPAVQRELIEHPLTTKRFEFEALESLKLIREGTLEVYDKVSGSNVKSLAAVANSSFFVNEKSVDVLQEGEMESVAGAFQEGSAVVVDERTLRLFIENPKEMKKLLEMRFKKNVTVDEKKMNNFSAQFKGLAIIRSAELVGTAFRMGLLDGYLPQKPRGKELLLDSILWAVKVNGCAISEHEIEELEEFLLKKKA